MRSAHRRREVPTGNATHFTRNGLARLLGMSPDTIMKNTAAGMPYVQKGGPGRPWLFDSTAAVAWIRNECESGRTGEAVTAFDAAALREREARATQRELTNAERQAELIDVETVTTFIGNVIKHTRARFLDVPNHVAGITPVQRQQMTDAINDAFAEVSGDKLEDWPGPRAVAESEDDFG
jgi:phage terminase Nu1 subunit (DNA packaging protein)